MEEKIYFKEALKSLLNEYSQNPNPEDIPLLEYIKQCLKGSDILGEKMELKKYNSILSVIVYIINGHIPIKVVNVKELSKKIDKLKQAIHDRAENE